MFTITDIEQWMKASEDEHLEFKEAKNRFDFEELVKYCCALANEGGGKIVLGITDKKPRRVVGSQAFTEIVRTKAGVGERLRLRIETYEISHPDGRIIVFDVPSRPIGYPIEYKGTFWMRRGEELVGMSTHQIQRILSEAVPDFSALICPSATMNDLEPKAIKRFRERWIRSASTMPEGKATVARLKKLSDKQLLSDAELISKDGITYAALVLFGKSRSLGKLLGNSEIIFEYRNTKASGPANFRQEFREGFFLFYDEILKLVNRWNTNQSYQDGLTVLNIKTFNERVIREAVLNAVSHRDYRNAGSIFVREYPEEIRIESPGGFPPGITEANIYETQNPRNRRIAEIFFRCGLVERSGQGANLIIELMIQEGKSLPDYSKSNEHQVNLRLSGTIQDKAFLLFLEKFSNEFETPFSTEDYLLLELIRKEEPLPSNLKPELKRLADLGIIEGISRGRGRKYFLSEKFYAGNGKREVSAKKKGLDKESNKAILLKYILENAKIGVIRHEFIKILPFATIRQIKSYLSELQGEGKIKLQGSSRASRWFPV